MMKASHFLAASLAALLVTLALAEDAADITPFLDQSGERKSLHTVFPVYPRSALRDRIEGDVEVCFDVDRDGKTSRISVRRSSNRVFEKAAMRAVRESTYVKVPADVVLSGIKTCRTFRFRLDAVAGEDVKSEPVPDSADVKP